MANEVEERFKRLLESAHCLHVPHKMVDVTVHNLTRVWKTHR